MQIPPAEVFQIGRDHRGQPQLFFTSGESIAEFC